MKAKLLLAASVLAAVLLGMVMFVPWEKISQSSNITTYQLQTEPLAPPRTLQDLQQRILDMKPCPTCHGAGYWLEFPDDLCPKCHGYGEYIVHIEYHEEESPTGERIRKVELPFMRYMPPPQGDAEVTITCEQCNGTGISWKPQKRCPTCGGKVTSYWLSEWKDAAYEAAKRWFYAHEELWYVYTK